MNYYLLYDGSIVDDRYFLLRLARGVPLRKGIEPRICREGPMAQSAARFTSSAMKY
jgi:hypothetical protein